MKVRSWLIGAGLAVIAASGCGGAAVEASLVTDDPDAGDAGSGGPSRPSGDSGGTPEAGPPLKLGEVKVGAPSNSTTSEDGGTTTFTVALGSKPSAKVSLALVVDKPGEAELDKTILTFDATNYAEPQTVSVTGKDDDADDGDVPYAVVFAMAASSDPAYAGVIARPVALTNIDNDTGGLVVSAPTKTFTTEKGGTTTFTVRLRTKPSADVTVPIASTKPAEGTVDKTNLIFTPANYKTEQTVTVTGADEAKPDGDVAYKVTVGKTTSQDAVYRDLEDDFDLTNVDDDVPVQIVNSGLSACVRFVDGNVKCWGRNESGQLGYGDTRQRGDDPDEMGANLPFVNLGTNRTVRELATSSGTASFFCAILDDEHLKCWGRNDYGQLGYGDPRGRGDDANEMGDNLPFVNLGAGRTAKSVSLGGVHACALLDNGRIKCWGWGVEGRLGYGDVFSRGEAANQMGDDLPYVDLGAGRTAKAISCGGYHTCALLDNDKIKCWGANYYGELGYGDRVHRGDDPSEMGENLPFIDVGNGRTVKSIVARNASTCALLDDDRVKCWGINYGGTLGLGDENARGDVPNEMGDSLPALEFGAGRKVVALYGSCVRLDDGALKCWGPNGNGELGYGDINTRGINLNQMGDNLLPVDLGSQRKATFVTSTVMSTCAILDDRTVKCWGNNDYGQLGYGDILVRGAYGGTMGNFLPVVQLK